MVLPLIPRVRDKSFFTSYPEGSGYQSREFGNIFPRVRDTIPEGSGYPLSRGFGIPLIPRVRDTQSRGFGISHFTSYPEGSGYQSRGFGISHFLPLIPRVRDTNPESSGIYSREFGIPFPRVRDTPYPEGSGYLLSQGFGIPIPR